MYTGEWSTEETGQLGLLGEPRKQCLATGDITCYFRDARDLHGCKWSCGPRNGMQVGQGRINGYWFCPEGLAGSELGLESHLVFLDSWRPLRLQIKV